MTAQKDQSEVCATHACFNIDIHIYDTLGFQSQERVKEEEKEDRFKDDGKRIQQEREAREDVRDKKEGRRTKREVVVETKGRGSAVAVGRSDV